MGNLLKETERYIKDSGHTTEDIIFIDSEESGHCWDWLEFDVIGDINYDSGFDAQEIATDLVTVFSDGNKMWIDEYDDYEYSTPFNMPLIKRE